MSQTEATEANLAGRMYVPVATLLLVLIGGNWCARHLNIDVLTAAQNKRLTFQSSVGVENAATALTPAEAQLAGQVLDRDRVAAPGQRQLLYMGNSQSLAIMDRMPGDLTTPQWLQVLLARGAAAPPPLVRLGCYPNMTAAEMLVTVVSDGEAQPRRADAFIAAEVLEEFRGLGVRDEIQARGREPQTNAMLKKLTSECTDLPSARTAIAELTTIDEQIGAHPADSAANSNQTYVSPLDDHLSRLAEGMPLFSQRDQMYVYVATKYSDVRNQLLGITSATARPVPENTYRSSLELIEMTLRYAKAKQIEPIIFLAPMRPIKPNPNVSADVERFRRDVPEFCNKYGVTCLDYVDLVPEKLWTNYSDDAAGTAGQRDFAHFTGGGHRLLAETLMKDIGARVTKTR